MGGIVCPVILLVVVSSCKSSASRTDFGSFDARSGSFHTVVPPDAYAQRIGIDFQFTEGPAVMKDGTVLFSDIPANTIYHWTGKKYEVYKSPSGNSNGLLIAPGGNLLACEHGTRSITRSSGSGRTDTLATHFRGMRFNSPNDLCMASDGTIYFTDPPWGLPGRNEDPDKEIPFNGVYRLSGGEVELIDSTLSWPNGIALSPDEQFLYVANFEPGSGPGDQGREVFWMRYRLNEAGQVLARERFFQAQDPGLPGGPDGMKADRNGNLFLTGPGGILVVTPEGEHLGTIGLPEIPSNLAFGPRGKVLYVTAGTMLVRVVLKE